MNTPLKPHKNFIIIPVSSLHRKILILLGPVSLWQAFGNAIIYDKETKDDYQLLSVSLKTHVMLMRAALTFNIPDLRSTQ